MFQTTTKGYNPKANGSAESAVKTVKTLVRRLLVHSGLPEKWWAHAALHATEVLRTKRLERLCDFPAFGEVVAAQVVRRGPSGAEPLGSKEKQPAFLA